MALMLSSFLTAIATLLETGVTSDSRWRCTTTLSDANLVADQLQLHYYNTSAGQYNHGELWTDANTFEDLHNLMLATGCDDFENVADTSYIGKAALEPKMVTAWAKFLGDNNDDAQSSAAKICDMIAREWRRWRDVITNELFLLTSAAAYLPTKKETYLKNADKVVITWPFSTTNAATTVTGMVSVNCFRPNVWPQWTVQ
ncbi:uncharacterized protein BJ212DRAFT_1299956 [Suillus subaureus]|uniref:Uncharacterized protein n=1 Tax=Suillus subaureus TaxID=48587 RepID=A0A9P7EB43_9AGAM|nr:uncharacterized protein BJ212DRAFT_1299956 [Suillus subaureus]KAG1816137.1 hypothetical protein BJ212DRAFT_1299956 [Suillus subaureus]